MRSCVPSELHSLGQLLSKFIQMYCFVVLLLMVKPMIPDVF